MFDLIAPWLFSTRFLSDAAYLAYEANDSNQQPMYAWRAQYLAQQAYSSIPALSQILYLPDTCRLIRLVAIL